MLTINTFKEFNVKILFIKELNNYFTLSKTSPLKDGISQISEEQFLDIVKANCPEKYKKFLNILKNREVNTEVTNTTKKYVHYSVCLHPSRTCNLSCKYCFAKEGDYLPKSSLTIETAKSAIDFLIYELGPNGSRYDIDLSGSGEPLLNLNLIKQIENYCEEKRNETGKDLKIMFPTNATLLNKEIADYFNNKPNILLGVSIDGSKRYNSNRLFKDGSNAYNEIKNGINLVSERKIGLAVTITHNNENVDEIFDHLYKFNNIDAISMHVVRDYRLYSETSFYKINIKNLIEHYKLLTNKLFEHIEKEDYNYLFTLLRGVDTFGTYIKRATTKGLLNQFRCGGGKNRIAVDEKGDIFTCGVMNGSKDFKIGNIYEGIDYEKQKKHLKANVNVSDKCRHCWASYICSGECPVTSYLTHKDFYEPNEEVCIFRTELIKLSIAFIEKLIVTNFKAYKVLLEFVASTHLYEFSDSGLWALNYYLKSNKINVTYSDLTKNIPQTQWGIHPSKIQEYLYNYDKKFCAFEVDNIEYYNNLNYPVIAFMNKSGKRAYEYAIIKGIKNGFLQLKTLDNTDIVEVHAKIFNSQISSIVLSSEIS